jgi:hypothetical protein
MLHVLNFKYKLTILFNLLTTINNKPGGLDHVSIETLDLDTGREPVSTVEKILTLSKS